MRKFLVSAAVVASALAVAGPAAAQLRPQGTYGEYNQGQGYNRGQARAFLARVDQIRRQIDRLDRRNRISEREARDLRREADALRDRIRRSSFNGLSYRERRAVEVRIERLEWRVRREVRD